jgi:CO/xanthine dehydrogenase Mo-binding subunit
MAHAVFRDARRSAAGRITRIRRHRSARVRRSRRRLHARDDAATPLASRIRLPQCRNEVRVPSGRPHPLRGQPIAMVVAETREQAAAAAARVQIDYAPETPVATLADGRRELASSSCSTGSCRLHTHAATSRGPAAGGCAGE